MSDLPIQCASFAELSRHQLYELLRLRVDVFVVEQDCPYPELDGRDHEPETRHLWIERDEAVVATVRVLYGPGEQVSIGRVATRAEHRGRGYAAALLREALRLIGPVEVSMGAQCYLQGWYEQFGFVRAGEDYLEDGIAHLPMVRPALK